MIGDASSISSQSSYAGKSNRPADHEQIISGYSSIPDVTQTHGSNLLSARPARLVRIDTQLPIRAINRAAAPVRVALKIQERLKLADAVMARVCGLNVQIGESLPTALLAAMRQPDVEARLRALFNIQHSLSALYATVEAERGWLRTPVRILGEKVPLHLLEDGAMFNVLAVDDALRHLTST